MTSENYAKAIHYLACPRWDENAYEDCIYRSIHDEDAEKRGPTLAAATSSADAGAGGLLDEAQAIVDTVDALGPFRDETGDELDVDDLRTVLAARLQAADEGGGG